MKTFDAIIIGSGQGGTPLAKKLAKAGWKTALIEKKDIGGTCVNVGCTPTKTMVASAKVAYTLATSAPFGVVQSGFSVDMPAIKKRKDEVVQQFRGGSIKGLESTENLTLVAGTATFTVQQQIEVTLNDGGKEMMTAGKIFIDAGCRPSPVKIEGLNEDYLTSSTILDLEEVPGHLLIIGGGYIALEFGQMFRRFGSDVTILEHGKQFLSREDEDVAAEVRKFLEAEDIKVYTQAEVTKVQKTATGFSASVIINGKEETIEYTHLLVAVGRTPNSDSLNLQAAGIDADEKGHIKVNDRLETSAPGVYALGDIKGGPEFTHISYNDHIVLTEILLEHKDTSIAGRMVPYCMFTDPQLGRVGVTEAYARSKGFNIKAVTLPMAKVARAIETGDTRGIMKAIVDLDTGLISGAAIVGSEGGEIMTILQMAMVGGITWQQLSKMIFAHPLYAESLNNLFADLKE